MFGIDWNNLELYHYLAIGGGALILLAIVAALAFPKIKLGAGVVSTLAALVVGVSAGVLGMTAFGYQPRRPIEPDDPDKAKAAMITGPKMGAPFGIAGGPPGGGMPGGKGGKGNKGPSPKTQLAFLVVKIHQLSDAPLSLKLNAEQRQNLLAQLKDLDTLEELADDDAQTRLKAVLEVVSEQRKTLEAAGYRWPDAGPPQFPPAAPNPFASAENRAHLTGLQEALGKKQ